MMGSSMGLGRVIRVHPESDSILLIFIIPALCFLLVYLPWLFSSKHPERMARLRRKHNPQADTPDNWATPEEKARIIRECGTMKYGSSFVDDKSDPPPDIEGGAGSFHVSESPEQWNPAIGQRIVIQPGTMRRGGSLDEHRS